MAKKSQLKNRQGDNIYPITTTECVITNNGRSIKEEYATKQYADEAAADILNSSPEQLQVINTLGEKLADDSDLANAVTKTVADSKKALFIDMWNKACGKYGTYNAETGYFELNGLTDITYEQALIIYKWGNWSNRESFSQGSSLIATLGKQVRTTIPSIMGSGSHYYEDISWTANSLEVLKFGYSSTSPAGTFFLLNVHLQLNSRYYLKKILDILKPTRADLFIGRNDGWECDLETLYLYQLSYNIKLHSLRILNLESLRFLVDNAANTTPITVTIHPDIFAKLTDANNTEWYQVNQDAIAKQITFASQSI